MTGFSNKIEVVNRVQVSSVLNLLALLKRSKSSDEKMIKELYNRHYSDFDSVLYFAVTIGLVGKDSGKLLVVEEFRDSTLQDLKEALLKKLILNPNEYTSYIQSYLKNFTWENGRYQYLPTTKQRIEHSGIRNIFIDLGLVNRDGDQYFISKRYAALLSGHNKKAISPDQLQNELQNLEAIGRIAEIEVLKEERARLERFPSLHNKIEHTAATNVRAGYDIKSFEVVGKTTKEKYIEVKAVSVLDFGFNWSRNEMEQAKLLGTSYFLYLLPITQGGNPDITLLREIRDPYKHIYKKVKKWTRTTELIHFEITRQ